MLKHPNITFHSVLDKYTDIEERNAHFDELEDQGKRLEIAWDALKLLDTGTVLPSYGSYWDFSLSRSAKKQKDSKSLQNFLMRKSTITSCEVCARGAVVLSQIRLGNGIKPTLLCVDGSEDQQKGFSMNSMYNMEDYYEAPFPENKEYPYNNNTRERMMNIFCNVLVNGDFNPKDKTDYLI